MTGIKEATFLDKVKIQTWNNPFIKATRIIIEGAPRVNCVNYCILLLCIVK